MEYSPPETLAEREPIPTGVSSDMLSAFGNHEAKALLLMAMEPASLYTSDDLHKLYLSIQGGTIAWKTDRRVQYRYCTNSLEPIGMVAQSSEDTGTGAKVHYLTDFGRDAGQAYAGLMADASLTYGVSLQVFGRTNTSGDKGTRPPEDCIEILRFISSSDSEVRLADIADIRPAFNAAGVRAHILRLADAGLIHLDLPGSSMDVTYVRTGEVSGDFNDRPFYGHLGQFILDSVLHASADEVSSLSIGGLEASYRELFGNSEREYSRRELRGFIASGLANLMRQGVLIRTSKMHATKRSNISVDDRQREVNEQLIEATQPSRQYCEVRTSGHVKRESILRQPSLIRCLLNQAKTHSVSANPCSSEDVAIVMDALIADRPITTTDIHNYYKDKVEGRSLTAASVKNILRGLEASGKVKMIKTGRSLYWQLEQPES